MDVPNQFTKYLAFVTLVLLLGIGILVLETVITRPGLVPLNATELSGEYVFYTLVVVPRMTHVYPQLLLSNTGVALFILLVPFYWVGIWWFRRDLVDHVLLLMQGTVVTLVAALGHNSFSKAWVWYKTLPPDIVATLYYPHGVLEMLAFILAGTFPFSVSGSWANSCGWQKVRPISTPARSPSLSFTKRTGSSFSSSSSLPSRRPSSVL